MVRFPTDWARQTPRDVSHRRHQEKFHRRSGSFIDDRQKNFTLDKFRGLSIGSLHLVAVASRLPRNPLRIFYSKTVAAELWNSCRMSTGESQGRMGDVNSCEGIGQTDRFLPKTKQSGAQERKGMTGRPSHDVNSCEDQIRNHNLVLSPWTVQAALMRLSMAILPKTEEMYRKRWHIPQPSTDLKWNSLKCSLAQGFQSPRGSIDQCSILTSVYWPLHHGHFIMVTSSWHFIMATSSRPLHQGHFIMAAILPWQCVDVFQ